MCGQGKTARRKRALPLFSLLHQSLAGHSRFALESEEEAGFIHYKVSTENEKIGQVRMLTRRRGSTPDIKWRGWGRSGIYPLKNFHGKNWTSRSAVSLSPQPPHPPTPPTHMFQRAVKQACWPRGLDFKWRGWSNGGKNQTPPKKIPRASNKKPKKSLEQKLIQKYSHA